MAAVLSRDAIEALEAAGRRTRPSLHHLPPAEARACYEREAAQSSPAQRHDVHEVRDLELPGTLPARLYRPAPGRLPVVLFFHGGGWVVGSIETHDRMCRELATRSGCAVLSVGYRLAPEHPYPAAVDDAEAALSWVQAEAAAYDLDASRLAVAGDSAGGNVAAALTVRAHASAAPLRLQVLFYPVTTTDLTTGVDPSYDGVVLSGEELAWHQDQYLPHPDDRARPDASPLDGADLEGLPAAVVVVAECDPIAPQGLLYAEALRAAGVPVTVHLHRGAIHGFAQDPDAFRDGGRALEQAAEALRGALLAPAASEQTCEHR